MPLIPRLRRIGFKLIKIGFGLVVLSILAVVILRYMAPPVSALMIERRVSSWFHPEKYSASYQWVSLDQIAPPMSAAVIAAEDQNFPDHHGFDMAAIQRALNHNERSARTRGASTLTQQTAKNLFLWSGRSWVVGDVLE